MVIRINTPVLLIGFLKNLKIKMNALFCLFFHTLEFGVFLIDEILNYFGEQ